MSGPTDTPWSTGTAGTYYFFDSAVTFEGRINHGVLFGLDVTATTTPSMTLDVAPGVFHQETLGTPYRTFSGGTVTLDAADPLYPRIDYVSIYWDGVDPQLVVTKGVPDSSVPLPLIPIPEGSGAGIPNIVLALVMVHPIGQGSAGGVVITELDIFDRRFLLPFNYTGSVEVLATADVDVPTAAGRLAIWEADGNLHDSGINPALGGRPFASAQGSYNTDNSERNLLSFVVPGGTLGATGGLLWFVTARVISNSGTNNWTLRIKFGATTLMGEASSTLSNNANPRVITMWGTLWNNAAAGAQIATVQGAIGVTTAGSIAGVIDINAATTATAALIEGSGVSSEDSTADKVFTVSGQFAVSNSAVSIDWKAAAYLI